MFFIGGEYNYHNNCRLRDLEIETYCKLEGVSLMDIKKSLRKESIISKIVRFFVLYN